MSFHENRQWQKRFRASASLHKNRHSDKVFEQAWVFTKIGKWQCFRASMSFHANRHSDKNVFEQAWVFMKRGTISKMFSSKREFSRKSAQWQCFRASLNFHENRHNGNHTLLKDVNELISRDWFWWNQGASVPSSTVEQMWVSRKSSQSHTLP